MQNHHILKVTNLTPARQKIKEMAQELDCGMKLIGYEKMEMENSSSSSEKSVSYKNEEKVVTFYIKPYDLVDFKVLKLNKKDFTNTTQVFRSVGIQDISALLKLAS